MSANLSALGVAGSLLSFSIWASAATPIDVRAFEQNSLHDITAARSNEPFLLVLWSVDCPPCFTEFESFERMRSSGRSLPLVLISTDGLHQREKIEQTLGRFGLTDVESWVFRTAHSPQLRFAVDPQWYGEMPRTYFYDAHGKREAVSGEVSQLEIEKWLVKVGVARPR